MRVFSWEDEGERMGKGEGGDWKGGLDLYSMGHLICLLVLAEWVWSSMHGRRLRRASPRPDMYLLWVYFMHHVARTYCTGRMYLAG